VPSPPSPILTGVEPFDWSRWLERSGGPAPLERTLYEPQPDSPRSCPECGGRVAIGVRAEGTLDLRCPEHGSRYAVPPLGLAGPLLNTLPRAHRMNPEERLWMLTAACTGVLDDPRPDQWIIVDANPCEFLILRRWPDGLAVEVGCREWDCVHCGNRPLPGEAVEALRELGFAPGGHHRNPCRSDLPEDARRLAVLIERALVAAYGLAADFEVVVYPCDTAACERLLGRLGAPGSL
jgi:hypothetical protein